jgi:arsenite methyltransferase
MAELTTHETTTPDSAASSCCSAAAQETCCEPSEKAACCDTAAAGGTCGCAAGQTATTGTAEEVREAVRERYAGHAKLAIEDSPHAARQAEEACCGTTGQSNAFGDVLYGAEASEGATEAAVAASLGCGVPTAVADLHEGETVLDLGSGAGADVLIAARRVGPTGRAIGLDMTDEMLELARRNAATAGASNVEFLRGYIEELPLPDNSVDVVISNCVINLSADKHQVIREAARVLRPGGRFAVSDVVADPDMDEAMRHDMEQWTGCIAGALTRRDFERELVAAGFEEVEVAETHRVHDQAVSAIIRARLPR